MQRSRFRKGGRASYIVFWLLICFFACRFWKYSLPISPWKSLRIKEIFPGFFFSKNCPGILQKIFQQSQHKLFLEFLYELIKNLSNYNSEICSVSYSEELRYFTSYYYKNISKHFLRKSCTGWFNSLPWNSQKSFSDQKFFEGNLYSECHRRIHLENHS